MKPYRDYEDRIEHLIAQKFFLDLPVPSVVKEIDNRMLATEAKFLFNKPPVPWSLPDPYLDVVLKPWSAVVSEVEFLARFKKLFEDANGKLFEDANGK